MSTSLLDELLTDHLDKGYAEAANRRSAAQPDRRGPASSGGQRVILAVGLVLLGFLLAAAYRATVQRAPDSARVRQALVSDIERGSLTSDELERRVEAMTAALARERDAALTANEAGDRVAQQIRRLESGAAAVSVRGPGISVVLGDAAPQHQLDPATGAELSVPPDDSGRLRDRDLQSVVNALWASGAEAVAIDGERLAPTTTIRAAGEAILVDLYPVSNPYTVEAIGNPNTLLPRFADSAAARRYQSLSSLYGIRFTVRHSAELRLRAATGSDLRFAEPLGSPPPATPAASGTRPAPSSTPSGPVTPTGASASPTSGGGP